MTFVLAASPLLLVVVALVSRRVTSLMAGLLGVLAACLVALAFPPLVLTGQRLVEALGKGLWLSWLVGAVILGGLFFRAAVSRPSTPGLHPATDFGLRRRRAFAACFLIGPFAETATGFGVGQVTTIAILMTLGLAPLHVATLGLFSQILVPWGAMANGTMVGAVFSGLTPRDLGFQSAIVNAPLVFAWLFLFWRFIEGAGLGEGKAHRLAETAWTIAMVLALILFNHWLGPETAALAALGPLIVLRFWHDERPDRARWQSLLPVALPYAALIVAIASTRAVPALNTALGWARVQPFESAPAWIPLLHPGSWLFLIAFLTLLILRRVRATARLLAGTGRQGWKAVATIGVFLVMAQVMADSGAARILADGMATALGAAAVLATAPLAGVFGFVTGSSNATNALIMSSQVSLSVQYGLSALWIAAIQNVAAAALTMLSPARVSMGCALAGDNRLEGQVYARAWILGVPPIVILTVLCGVLLGLTWER